MSHDLGERLAATLQDRAGGTVDTGALVRGARERGGRLRRRRWLLTSAGTAVLALAVAAVVLVTPGLPRPGGTATPALPAAADQPGAAARPDLVGTDPGVLHFTADHLVAGSTHVTWGAAAGVESVQTLGADVTALFLLAGDASALDGADRTLGSGGGSVTREDVLVGDRPGRAWPDGGTWTVDWQPSAGLWARLQMLGAGRAELLTAAAAIRFDGARRCAVPFRLTVVPDGMRTLSCSVMLGSGGFSEGALLVGDDDRWFSVRVERADGHRPAAPRGELTAGPYRVDREDTRALRTVAGSCYVGLIRDGWGSWAKGVTEPEALSVLAGYRPAGDPADPSSW
ncbi:hypothetical protein [Actinoplanes sp. G11-F43]|uniref:hypothetical protein n=1 Tax=Actinoplanes sp. G11-F43 TaxID=3424130 RepID=UPI003D34D7EC